MPERRSGVESWKVGRRAQGGECVAGAVGGFGQDEGGFVTEVAEKGTAEQRRTFAVAVVVEERLQWEAAVFRVAGCGLVFGIEDHPLNEVKDDVEELPATPPGMAGASEYLGDEALCRTDS